MKIKEIINETQRCGNNLAEYVRSSVEELKHMVNPTTNNPTKESPISNKRGRTMRYSALGLTALGVIGWASVTDSVWPKLSVGGGLALLIYDILKKRGKSTPVGSVSIKKSDSIVSKQSIQEKLSNIISYVEAEWEKTTHANQPHLSALVDGSSASSEDKFTASNTVSLPRKIQLSLLPYVVKILKAETKRELDGVLCNICDDFVNSISKTVDAQIADYRDICQKIGCVL